MKQNEIYISRFSAWAPGLENKNDWKEWVLGKREITPGPDSPDISFTPPMFRRRLSQISKMTIQVVHDLLPVAENTKMLFLSFRGELSKQYKMNKTLIQDNDIMPATFSLSVFNAPVALASMAFSLKGGYSAIFPGGDSFAAGLSIAEAAFLCGESEELIFIYADEEIPNEYKDIIAGNHIPLAFGFMLTRKPSFQGSTPSVYFSTLKEGIDNPEDFLKRLILSKLS
ncbi:MAG: beta-ketoacyl synthase chain length factor [Treponema sp.]|nr:beta-ketoacyl synthase chain length factor [Treponema sp.]